MRGWIASATTTANGASDAPALSANGRYLAFTCTGTNLVTGQSDVNGSADVFVHDRLTGATERISPSGGVDGVISDDGNRVAYVSAADTIVPGDTNFTDDVFVLDRTTGTTVRASVAADGGSANNQSLDPSLNEIALWRHSE